MRKKKPPVLSLYKNLSRPGAVPAALVNAYAYKAALRSDIDLSLIHIFLFLPSLKKPAVLLDSEVWSNLLFLGVIASSACYLLWNIVVKQLGTIQASNYLYLNPLATTVGATIFLHEEVTPVAIGGIVLVLSGVYLATRNSRPQHSTAIKKLSLINI